MSPEIVMPPKAKAPVLVQTGLVALARVNSARHLRRHHGSAFSFRALTYGTFVVLSDPSEVRELVHNTAEFGRTDPNLGRILGPGSIFALSEEEHRNERKLLTPCFHGRRLHAHQDVITALTREAIARWPENEPFSVGEPLMELTFDIILRAVFGAEGRDFDELKVLLPRWMSFGQKLFALPIPNRPLFGLNPWERFQKGRDRYDVIIDRLIAAAQADPGLAERSDVLAIMVQSRYDDGSALSNSRIGDELLTLLEAGHETTASTLSWALERLVRHPEAVARLEQDLSAGRRDYLKATLAEVQRVRPVIDGLGRAAKVDGARVGRWSIPKDTIVVGSILLIHEDPEIYPEPHRFDPDRFLGAAVESTVWLPFGGGTRRCLGAAFAQLEMETILPLILDRFELIATSAPGEAWLSRGLTFGPKLGGRVTFRRRAEPLVDQAQQPTTD
ncbi:MAG: cytochrome P450 [Propionibacteriales bacterium]|nr:cytochrome P450 [Propionibacteriales bacterium]